jgi:hypothetical protein
MLCPKSKILLGGGFATIYNVFLELLSIILGEGMCSGTGYVTKASYKIFHTD